MHSSTLEKNDQYICIINFKLKDSNFYFLSYKVYGHFQPLQYRTLNVYSVECIQHMYQKLISVNIFSNKAK